MTPEDVSRYLATHPEFFDQFPHLLTDMRLSHPLQGRAISITERQVLNLREKIALLESRLTDFVQFGEENDLTSQRMHDLTVALIPASSPDQVSERLSLHLQREFNLPDHAIRVWADQPDLSPEELAVMQWVDHMPAPQCGATLHEHALSWLPNSDSLHSYAAIPLKHDRLLGVLLLGSADPAKFYPEMGTLFLQRLGDIVAASLVRFQDVRE